MAVDRHDRRQTGDLRPRLGRRRGHRPLALPALPSLGGGDDRHARALADVARDWATSHDVPIVFGEGWIGYTPRDGRFEEGPSAPSSAGCAIDESIRVGAWGTLVCSNAAPHHAMWADATLQQQCNEAFRTGTPLRPTG